ncbi:hypothetical protein GRF29_8g697760 [Pseudopithomyces chartarum]|uniref:Uncharacterized protein n=1 Tax=Pseudopithomyces chartarum TaxID=1892770 RepID=A0AAN6M7B8_9PLEO|nr:hypothetical protein GRF29_8g697760 [Pseudopithomyces chartarum]
MHSTLLLAALALSTLAIPVAQPLESRTEIQGCYRANSRSEGQANDASEEPKRFCKISHPRDIENSENSEDANIHYTTLNDRRYAQPEPIFRAGGRREVDPDDRVIIKSRNEANDISQEKGGIETRATRNQDKDRGSRPKDGRDVEAVDMETRAVRSQDKDRGSRSKGGRDVQKDNATRATRNQGRDAKAESTVRGSGRLHSIPGNRGSQGSNK